MGDLGGDGAAQGLLKWDKCDLFMWLFEMLLLIPPTGAVAGSILLPTSLQQLTTWLEDPVGVC